MTLEQLLSPAILEWSEANKHLPEDQLLQEFDKWFVENQTQINESVKNNFTEINECIESGKENARLLMESIDGEIDWDNYDDTDGGSKEPISGKIESEEGEETIDDVEETISGKIKLSNLKNNRKINVYEAVNSLLNFLERKKILHEENTIHWSRFDMSAVDSAVALLAFTDIPNANLKYWDMSSCEDMEGMFYKSTFNNDSICRWNVGSCSKFLRMFTFSDFNQTLYWKPADIEVTEYDSDGKKITDTRPANLPLIGAAADEEAAMIQKFWDDKFSEMEATGELKENKNLNKMKYIVDFDTFVNEGFGDFIKKGVNKIKSFFKNMTVKIDNFVAMFNNKGEIIDASSPYTALNCIANGEVEGVTAFTTVKNEFINDNVPSVATIVESSEYYGIVDKNSIEYQNYLTFKKFINEHNNKYGDVLNEAGRVGFSAESGGLKKIEDINSKKLVKYLNRAIKHVPAYKGQDFGSSLFIWGAPGIGKTTIPKSVIKAWNENNDINNKKSLMVVQCGDLTVDGFSLPMPFTKTLRDYLEERPKLKKLLNINDEEMLKKEIKVSGEAVKTWVPCYKPSPDPEENRIRKAVANGHIVIDYKYNEETEEYDTIVNETTEGGILLFDEFFRADPQIFKILMQILEERTFSGHLIGDKWAIVCCSNRPNDDDEARSGFESTGAVVGNRIEQCNFIPSFDEWKKWAIEYGHFDDMTITFLMQEKDPTSGEYTNWHTIIPENNKGGESVWPTPRSWSKAMVKLKNNMEDEGYDSISETPYELIRESVVGFIGVEMAEKYINFLKTFKTDFNPAEVLKNSKYVIPEDMKCSEVIDRLKKYIDLKFDKEKLPTDEEMVNMFNILEKTFSGSKDNYVRPLYVSLFHKFGFVDNFKDKDFVKTFATKLFPVFTKLFMKKYELSSPNELIDFLI